MTDSQLNSSSSGSAADEGCACPHPDGAHYAAFGCYYCECPCVPPAVRATPNELPVTPKSVVGGSVSGEEPPRSLPELVEHAKDVLARGYIDLEGFARALVSLYEARSSQPSSSSEIREAIDRLIAEAYSDGFCEIPSSPESKRVAAARSRLESLYLEQQRLSNVCYVLLGTRDPEKVRDWINLAYKQDEGLRAALSSLKDSQLTPEEARWLSDLLRVWHYPDDKSDLAAKLRAWGKAEK